MKVVYTGLRLVSLKGKVNEVLSCRWLVMNDDGSLDTSDDGEKWFTSAGRKDKSLLTTASIGDIVTANVVPGEGGRLTYKDAVKTGRYDDAPTLRAWKVDEDSDRATVEARKKITPELGEMTLEELRQQFRKAVGSVRQSAVLAVAIRHITA